MKVKKLSLNILYEEWLRVLNKVTIEFGEGTKAWEDMQDVMIVLKEKGYSVEPYEEIGTVKLTKEIVEEMSEEDRGAESLAAVYHSK